MVGRRQGAKDTHISPPALRSLGLGAACRLGMSHQAGSRSRIQKPRSAHTCEAGKAEVFRPSRGFRKSGNALLCQSEYLGGLRPGLSKAQTHWLDGRPRTVRKIAMIRAESTVASASLLVTCLDLICLYLMMVTESIPA